jgi:hypothetical protein
MASLEANMSPTQRSTSPSIKSKVASSIAAGVSSDKDRSPWKGVEPDLESLRTIVSEFFRNPAVGPPCLLGVKSRYARVYTFHLSDSHKIIARVVAPIKPLFKTESEIAAMDFVRSM